MNRYMDQSVRACLSYIRTFEQNVTLAASKDDGRVDPSEERELRRIMRATKRFRKKLERMAGDA